ncbi:hypothetical protein BsWGS_23443 [Bradybaena similaris]
MSERTSLDRLLLPRMRAEPEGAELLVPESSAPLPRWQTLPLDAKFPVTPGAKDQVTFVTTRMCQPAYKSTQHETFDLTDPYNRTIQTEYQALRDPYLKDWLAKPYVRKQLLDQNLLTASGKVPCTVRDFNNYRNFLRRQALIKNKEPKALTRATENRNTLLRKTKMKAELVSLEVKCKSLKAQQMQKEAEEERQRQFLKKQALELEREQNRLEEEKKSRDELAKNRRDKWIEKQKRIKEQEESSRRELGQKVLEMELEAREKLSRVDTMRQGRQLLLEARRRQQWQQKRQHQLQVMEQTMLQQKRVEGEMEMRRRQYEEKMTSSLVKLQAAAVDTPAVETPAVAALMKTAHEDGAQVIAGQETARMMHDTFEPEMNLSRRGSMWIVEELLYSSGMIEEVNLLFSTSSPQEYSQVLDKVVGSVMRRTRSASVLGVEQDALSKIIHLVVRQLEEAYHQKRQRQLEQDPEATADAEAECMKRFFTGVDTSLETEMAHHVSMSATLDMDW